MPFRSPFAWRFLLRSFLPTTLLFSATIFVLNSTSPYLPRISNAHVPLPTIKIEPFVVHEWGTFTSLQGSDGEAQEGLHHEEEALPIFVHQRWPSGGKGMETMPHQVTQRMETPVIYFYTAKKKRVHVKVNFPQGVISQWYPAADSFLPQIGRFRMPTRPAEGSMTWDVRLQPFAAPPPPVEKESVWQPSREVPQAMPVFVEKTKQQERFIFYRGLGNFKTAIQIGSNLKSESLVVRNTSKETIPAGFLLWVREGQGAVKALRPLSGNSERVEAQPTQVQPMESYLKEAKAQLAKALIASGLYKDEAWAMVRTWQRSYFQTPGLRLLYIVPQTQADRLLPLRITPSPTALVRTFVGRIEILTAQKEHAFLAQIRAAEQQRRDVDLKPMGRFAEPILRRLCPLLSTPGLTAVPHSVAFCNHFLRQATLAR